MKNKKAIISEVYKNIREEHSQSVNRDSIYSRGLSLEGYTGGYLQALQDVALFLNGVIPNSRYENIWHEAIVERIVKLTNELLSE